MQLNETLMTPIYRYIIETISQYGVEKLDISIEKIGAFCTHWHNDNSVKLKNSFDDILTECTELLKIYMKNQDEAEKSWKQNIINLKEKECNRCVSCRQCTLYFWKELGEILFEIPNDEKNEGKYFPLRSLPDRIASHLEPTVGMPELYRHHAKGKNDIQDKLIILKGMSSSTPAMLNSIYDTEQFDGGGWYLNYNGYGIAVDPGYHFMRNLHHYGLSVLDINAVIITHEHIDHNNDMRLLDDIHFSVYRYGNANESEHVITWYLDPVSYQLARILQRNNVGFNENANELYCVDIGHKSYYLNDEKKVLNDITLVQGLKLRIFPTRHIYDEKEQRYCNHTFGFSIEVTYGLEKRNIVYTSDTCFFPELVDYIGRADILIANISGIYEDDYMLVKEKKKHLGYFGCFELIKEGHRKNQFLPKYILLSEFWNGKSDIRFDVSKQLLLNLKEIGMDDCYVIPSERGMIIDIPQLRVRCSQCNRFSDKVIIKKPNKIDEEINVVCANCYY